MEVQNKNTNYTSTHTLDPKQCVRCETCICQPKNTNVRSCSHEYQTKYNDLLLLLLNAPQLCNDWIFIFRFSKRNRWRSVRKTNLHQIENRCIRWTASMSLNNVIVRCLFAFACSVVGITIPMQTRGKPNKLDQWSHTSEFITYTP